jgi:hypothetical protein
MPKDLAPDERPSRMRSVAATSKAFGRFAGLRPADELDKTTQKSRPGTGGDELR